MPWAHGTFMPESIGVVGLVDRIADAERRRHRSASSPAGRTTWTPAFSRLRAQGGFLVTAEQKDGEVVRLEITSTVGGTLRLLSPWKGITAGGKVLASGRAGDRHHRDRGWRDGGVQQRTTLGVWSSQSLRQIVLDCLMLVRCDYLGQLAHVAVPAKDQRGTSPAARSNWPGPRPRSTPTTSRNGSCSCASIRAPGRGGSMTTTRPT